MRNPFIILDYISPKYFCDREKETSGIISALNNGRNITVTSIRRLGKTGLIKNVFFRLKNERKTKLLYVDILKSENFNDFVKILSDEIVKTEHKKFTSQLTKFISAIRGKIVFDEFTGMPGIELNLSDRGETEMSLNKIFEYLASKKERYIIAFDEFQQIVNYPENNMEAILRTHIQHQHKDLFIFSGSDKHMLISMFNDYGRPFYQSSDMLHLQRLDAEIYSEFILNHFKNSNKNIEVELIKFWIDEFNGHTFYIQYFFNRLFESEEKTVTDKMGHEIFTIILSEREHVYLGYRNILTRLQFNLLKAIAKEQGVSKPNAGEFIRKYNFSQPSSVSKTIKSLLDKEMLYLENGIYKVYDVFFSKWLEKN